MGGTLSESNVRLMTFVAACIAVTTLAAAAVEHQLIRVNETADTADIEGRVLGAQAAGEALRDQQWALTEYEAFVQMKDELVNQKIANEDALLAPPDSVARLSLEAERWSLLAMKTHKLVQTIGDRLNPPLQIRGLVGPDIDPTFPARFFTVSGRRAIILQARQEEMNERASAGGAKASRYVVVLAMFSVALFLLGSVSTIKAEKAQLSFGVLALLILLLGGSWTIVLSGPLPKTPSPAAATSFASSHLVFQTALTPREYGMTIPQLEKAERLNPGFAPTHEDLGEALFRASLDGVSGYPVLSDMSKIEQSVKELELAEKHGRNSFVVLNDLGYERILIGVRQGNLKLVGEGVRELDRAIDAFSPADPAIYFRKAAGLLALRSGRAQAAYREAVLHAIFSDVGLRIRWNPYSGTELGQRTEQWVAAALSDLELLSSRNRDLFAQTMRTKALVLGSIAMGRPFQPQSSTPPSGGLSIRASADSLVMSGPRLSESASSRTHLSAQWYFSRDAASGSRTWAVLPQVSGDVTDLEAQSGVVSRSFLAQTLPPGCLPHGSYRMELYADGQMVGQVQTEAEWEDMRGSREQFFDLRLCRPPDWIPKRLDTGFAAGFVKSDGSRGVYGLRLHRVPSSRSAALSTILRSVFGSDGQAFGFAALDDARPISGLTFMNEPDSKVYGYDHGDRRIRLGTFDDDATGTVVIAFVFGPRSDFDAPEFGLVFDSFTTNLPS